MEKARRRCGEVVAGNVLIVPARETWSASKATKVMFNAAHLLHRPRSTRLCTIA